jgi:hypothetical protein
MQDMLDRMMSSFGMPDQLFMSASDFDNLSKAFQPTLPEDADAEGSGQSGEVPADKRD